MSPTSYQAAPPRVIDSTRLAALLQLSTRRRINSAKGPPASACFKTATICSTLKHFCFTANLPSLGSRFCRKLTFEMDQKYRGRSTELSGKSPKSFPTRSKSSVLVMTAMRARFAAPSVNRRTTVGGPVLKVVAFPTERDQIRLSVVTKSAASSHVVNVEIPGASTSLTAPTIPLQDLFLQPSIEIRRQSNSRPPLRARIVHVACSSWRLAVHKL